MPNNKYFSNVAPRLDQVEWWKRQGASNEEIAKKLDVSDSSFKLYLKKGRAGEKPYSDLSTLLDTAMMDLTDQVEAALFRKTQGYNVTVKKHIRHKVTDYDENGKRIGTHEEIIPVEDEVHVAADTQAQIFWLSRRRPDKWPLKPLDQQPDDRMTGVIELPPLPAGDLEPPPEIKAQLDAELEGVSQDE